MSAGDAAIDRRDHVGEAIDLGVEAERLRGAGVEQHVRLSIGSG
jgi:hypothetical protein